MLVKTKILLEIGISNILKIGKNKLEVKLNFETHIWVLRLRIFQRVIKTSSFIFDILKNTLFDDVLIFFFFFLNHFFVSK